MSRRTMSNKYAGDCEICGQRVEAGGGLAVGVTNGRDRRGWRYSWTVEHMPQQWVGSPVSGSWVGGCPVTAAANDEAAS